MYFFLFLHFNAMTFCGNAWKNRRHDHLLCGVGKKPCGKNSDADQVSQSQPIVLCGMPKKRGEAGGEVTLLIYTSCIISAHFSWGKGGLLCPRLLTSWRSGWRKLNVAGDVNNQPSLFERYLNHISLMFVWCRTHRLRWLRSKGYGGS